MKRMLLATLAVSVSVSVIGVGVPMSANADAGDSIAGECQVFTVASPTVTQGENDGLLEVTAQMLTSAHVPDSRASVDCKIQVVGVDAPGTEIDTAANAAGLVQGQQQISFDNQGTLSAALCEKDNWGDGDTSGWVCKPYQPTQVPEQDVTSLIGGLIDTLFSAIICPALETLQLGHCVQASR
jgi:hypothetical protein